MSRANRARKTAIVAGLLAGSLLGVRTVAMAAEPGAPVAAQKPHAVASPFGERQDPYYWLRDDTRKNSEMLGYLAAENAWADRQLAPTKALKDALFAETVAHIKQDDSSVPWRKHGYWYATRFVAGADYPVVERRKAGPKGAAMPGAGQVLFDEPAMARGHGYFSLGGWDVAPGNARVAWTQDTVGRRQYVLKIKDIATGAELPDTISNVEPSVAWSADGRMVFYIEKDPVTLRGWRLRSHTLGTAVAQDPILVEEKDETFNMDLAVTSDESHVCSVIVTTVSTEQRCTPRANPGRFTLIAPRERELRYSADHMDGRWIVLNNRGAKNYKLSTVGDADLAKGPSAWADLVPASPDVFIEDFKPFHGFIAIDQRQGGNRMIRVLTAAGKSLPVKADEPAYRMMLDTNPDPASGWVRYTYSSLVTPVTTIEVNAQTGARRVLKVAPVPGYDASRYVTERVWSTARDGTRVPVSIVRAKTTPVDGSAPMMQYAYGAYGISTDPVFDPARLALLDRGVIYAIAHIRGGQEMGRDWYDQGHLLNKKNSFTDFIDVTRDLVRRGYAAKGRVTGIGGSAGGLLMGAVANMAEPGEYRTIVAQVPFVDVVTTMLDASIPLTTFEYDEWGNPATQPYYDYMLSYSPYDQVKAKPYPALFVGTGLWDSQVQYYEPTKWVARLRAAKTDTNPLVFRVNMEAGHGGKSGRFERYRDNAEWQAFALGQMGVK